MILRTDVPSLVLNRPLPIQRRRSMKPTLKGMIIWHLTALCYYLSQSLCYGKVMNPTNPNIIDLSYEFNNETIYWPTSKQLFMNVTHNGTVEGKGYWYQMEEISAGTHGGTHLDAPCHFYKGKWCVTDIPIDRLIVQSAVIDISDKVGNNPDIHLTPDDLKDWEKKYGPIPDGSLVLIRTGWAQFWPDRQLYCGTTERDKTLLKFPSILPEAAQWIVDNRKIVGLGIDTMSLDKPLEAKTHEILNNYNIYNLENVNNELRLLPPTGATVYVMPMKLKGASGAPCRVFAILEKQSTNQGICNICSWNVIVFVLIFYTLHVLQSRCM